MWKGDDGDTKVVIMKENEMREDDTRTDDQRHKKMIRF